MAHPSQDHINLDDAYHAYQMELGSIALLERVRREHGHIHDVRKASFRGEGLLWRDHAHSIPERTGTSRRHQEERAFAHMQERDAALARVVKRDPCPMCGTRSDIGCKHRRAA